jgi:protein gp37
MYRMYSDPKMNRNPMEVKKSKTTFYAPSRWRTPGLVFTCSMSDFFIKDADEWRDEAWALIKKCPHLEFQILTKRPERILNCLPEDWGEGYPNVWLGVSGENEKLTYERVQILLQVPAKIRFLSAEPLLEGICSQRNIASIGLLDWVILGGESGDLTGPWKFRPMEWSWVKEIIDVCKQKSTACFVKQSGSYLRHKHKYITRHGGNIDEWPLEVRIREYPDFTYGSLPSEPKQLNLFVGKGDDVENQSDQPTGPKEDHGKESDDLASEPFSEISLFKAPIRNIAPFKSISIMKVYTSIKGDYYKLIIEALRALTDPDEIKQLKLKFLDYVTFSGTFKHRRNDLLIKHSGLMVLDFDDIPNPDLLKAQLLEDQQLDIVMLFTSPSGKGLKCVMSVDIKAWSHSDYFEALSNYIEHTYSILIDQSGKDVSRACFLTHDPNIFLNNKYHNNENI